MSAWQAYLDDIVFSFRKHKEMAEQAFQQLEADDFFRKPGEHSNSIAIIVKHLAGNLTSRWTDFLTTDGDKPSRDRDAEFVIGPDDTRAKLLADWEKGWSVLLQTLGSLQESDWLKTIRIRGENHSVLQAIQRGLTHAVYHVGQIVYLARLLKTGEWKWITIPPGQSQLHRSPYLK
jgi:uncharacterized damage-inducible protein DinB